MNDHEAKEKFRVFVFEDRGVVVYETKAIVRSLGWGFYYQSELFFETGEALDGILGNIRFSYRSRVRYAICIQH